MKRILEQIEYALEQAIFTCRWLLAPFYIGLAISLAVMLIKFIVELIHITTHAFTASESDVIVGVLSLVDLALTGSLLVIVIFSGYENFVSRINHENHEDWPTWMGTIDFSALKLKLLSSIVAISAIQLLKQFMEIKKNLSNPAGERELMWYVIVHLVFVVSSVLLALSDRIAGDHHHAPANGNGGHGDKPEGQSHSETPVAAHGGGKPQSASAKGSQANRKG